MGGSIIRPTENFGSQDITYLSVGLDQFIRSHISSIMVCAQISIAYDVTVASLIFCSGYLGIEITHITQAEFFQYIAPNITNIEVSETSAFSTKDTTCSSPVRHTR